MEQRLIDANALWESAETCRETTGAFQALIESAPTVDAVPVVRCKDCKHYDGKWCLLLDMVNSDMCDWFCGYGERRTDGNET